MVFPGRSDHYCKEKRRAQLQRSRNRLSGTFYFWISFIHHPVSIPAVFKQGLFSVIYQKSRNTGKMCRLYSTKKLGSILQLSGGFSHCVLHWHCQNQFYYLWYHRPDSCKSDFKLRFGIRKVWHSAYGNNRRRTCKHIGWGCSFYRLYRLHDLG